MGDDNNWAWRVPLILQAFACVIVMGSVFFLPESPRFCMANGREEEALEFLVKYHGNGDPNSRLVRLEIDEMKEGIKLDGIDKTWWDYRPFLTSHNSRWRIAQVLMISIFGQFSGNGLGYFNTVIFKQLGITDVPQQLGYNILNQVLSAIGALTAVSLTDRMPRRKVLIIGTFVCALALATNSGLTETMYQQDPTMTNGFDIKYGQGALASYFLFNIIFSFTYTPLQGVIPTEALETTQRAKGLALSGILVSAVGFINQFAGPIALENIKHRYIFVFVGWDIIESIIWYFFWYVDFYLAQSCLSIPNHGTKTVSSPRVVLSSSWSGSTTSPTPSRPPSRSTRLCLPMTATSRRRSKSKQHACYGLGCSILGVVQGLVGRQGLGERAALGKDEATVWMSDGPAAVLLFSIILSHCNLGAFVFLSDPVVNVMTVCALRCFDVGMDLAVCTCMARSGAAGADCPCYVVPFVSAIIPLGSQNKMGRLRRRPHGDKNGVSSRLRGTTSMP
jgi:MFS family permease